MPPTFLASHLWERIHFAVMFLLLPFYNEAFALRGRVGVEGALLNWEQPWIRFPAAGGSGALSGPYKEWQRWLGPWGMQSQQWTWSPSRKMTE